MNTNTEYENAGEQNQVPFHKHMASSIAAKVMGLVAVGLMLSTPGARAENKLSAADNDFILAAAQGGMTEVKLGELAAEKGERDEVKAFGQMMVKDHGAINGDLKTLAAQKGVTLPDSLDAKHQGMVYKLTSLNGAEFDKAYIAAMTRGHKQDAKEFKAESAATQDADLKSFVDKTILVVEGHLQRITAMKK